MIDLYDYKFRYNFKKYETVIYNKVIFKNKPYPFNISKVRVAIESDGGVYRNRWSKAMVELVGDSS